jgi:histidine phosphotransferase ChpT
MPELDDLHLAELLCARLCHDLSGPIGGAAAGVELLADTDAPGAEDVRLLADSVTAAAGHLKFLRAALGYGTAPFAGGELEALCRAVFAGRGNLQLDWQGDRGEVPRSLGKLALVLVLVARDALARGGSVTVRLESASGRAEVVATGPSPGNPELLAGFDESVAQLSPRGAPARYAVRRARAGGASLRVEQGEGLLRLMVEPASPRG